MYRDGKIIIGSNENVEAALVPKMANRHGLIAGATGAGKTVTLRVMAESFSAAGVPVFLADAKGDISGLFMAGEGENSDSFPVTLWDVYGQGGIPLRTTISEMGPLLLARIMGLNDTQSDILTIVFKIADDENMLLIDTKDLKSMLQFVGENADRYSKEYGNIAKQSINTIVRQVVALEEAGGQIFFGEPALDIRDFIGCDSNGKGKIEILDCRTLMQNPVMYATFVLYMMAELFENLPECGDMEKPRMVFFFDEAHMLFDDAPKVLLQKVEQVVKLIRSKGVGIYFATQNPSDIPDSILAQLGNKVQHALHAYTPAEQKKVKAAAMSFRENPDFDTYEAITSLGIGEAVVSFLDESGTPSVSEKIKVFYPPLSKMGAITDAERENQIRNDILYGKYAMPIDNPSAYEFLQRMDLEKEAEIARAEEEKLAEKELERNRKIAERELERDRRLEEKELERREKELEKKELADAREKKRAIKSVTSSAAGTIGRELGKNIGGKAGTFGKTLGGNVGATLARGILNTLFKS